MRKFWGITLIILLFITKASVCQKTFIYNQPEERYRQGLVLFNSDMFSAAQNLFGNVIKSVKDRESEIKINSEFYYAICAAKLFNDDAEKLIYSFIANHGENNNVKRAYFELAKYQYSRKAYTKAIQSFSKSDRDDLSKDETSEYYFKIGYSYFRINKFNEAEAAFNEVKNYDNQYQSAAIYYYSHIAYTKKNYQQALEGFQKLMPDKTFGPYVLYYIVQIYYLQKKYDDVIRTGKPLVDSAKSVTTNQTAVTSNKSSANGLLKSINTFEIARLIGESYFKTDRYKESIPYLLKYMDKQGNVASREDDYELGFAYFKSGEYDKSVKLLENVAVKDDSLSQNANYNIADCYLKLGNKEFARNSFLAAYKPSFNKTIKEDALYNYAKLSYELFLNPYNEAISSIQKYIKAYPHSDRTDEMYSYLVNIYLTTNNYKDALVSIEGIKNKDAQMTAAYQKIAYSRGVDLYNNNDYTGAIALFKKTISISKEKVYTPQSYYWKAESFYKLNKFDSAFSNYRKFLITPGSFGLPYYNVANYNIGYCYFKNKDYQDALMSFRKYVEDSAMAPKNILNDALLRAGDCYFVNKDMPKAIEFYDKAIRLNTTDGDYALYQKGIALGVINKFDQKVEALKQLLNKYKKSSYGADAEYELANAYTSMNDNENALKTFQDIIKDYPKSIYLKISMLKSGLLQRNMNKEDEALATFKKVVTDFPGTAESKEALMSIRNIYVDMNKVDEFFVYVKNIPFANITNAAQDSITYVAVENKYMSGDCDKSIKGFNDYIQKFPEGIFLTEANFYLAECEYSLHDYDKAIAGYDYVLSKPKSKFTENSLLKAADINFFKKKDYKSALTDYAALESEADYKNDIIIARTGLMRTNLMLKDYTSAIRSSRKLLNTEKVTNDLQQEAHLTIAKSAMTMDSLDLAKKEFTATIKFASNEMAAESKYNLALIQYKQGKYDESEKTVFELINQVPSYDYWIADGFILLADNYVKVGNNFQAKQTLQSIIDNYDGEDLKKIARDKLNEITEKEKVEEQKKAEKEVEIKFGKDTTESKKLFEPDTIKK